MAGTPAAPATAPAAPAAAPAAPAKPAAAAKVDDFDAFLAQQDARPAREMDDGTDADDGDGGPAIRKGSLGSMFDEFADPVDQATGRALDGPALPGAEAKTAEAADDAADADADPDAQAQPDADLLHGLKPADVLASLKEGKIPEELLDHVMVTQKINGESVDVPAREALENGMRLVDYSRGKREVAEAREEHGRAVDAFTGLVEGWKVTTPEGIAQTRMNLELLGVPIHALAKAYADEWVQIQSMSEPERGAYEARKKTERENWELKNRLQTLEAKDRTREQSGKTSAIVAKIEKWMPVEFKAFGVDNTAVTRGMFRQHLRNLWDRSKDITQEDVRLAAKATQQDVILAGKLHQEQVASLAKTKPKPATLPAKPSASGGGSRANGAGSRIKPTVDNFDDWMASR